MRKFIIYLAKPVDDPFGKDMLRIVVIDLLTIGVGTFMVFYTSAEHGYHNEDGIGFGISLLVLGILIRLWRKEFKANKY